MTPYTHDFEGLGWASQQGTVDGNRQFEGVEEPNALGPWIPSKGVPPWAAHSRTKD